MSELKVYDIAILNEKCNKGLPKKAGEPVTILDVLYSSPNYEYLVGLEDGSGTRVKESELNRPTEEQLQLMTYIRSGNKVIYIPTNEEVEIYKCDFLHGQCEVGFEDSGCLVVGFELLRKKNGESEISCENNTEKLGYFAKLGLEVGSLVDEKQKAYGDSVTKCYEIMKVLLKDYRDEETNTYTIPESLLEIILLDVRKIDKLNRRFSNPNGDLMEENSFKDDVGYSLLGMRMIENVK